MIDEPKYDDLEPFLAADQETADALFEAMIPPEGFRFLGWYLPGVRTVFTTPARGMEDRFAPVFVPADWKPYKRP